MPAVVLTDTDVALLCQLLEHVSALPLPHEPKTWRPIWRESRAAERSAEELLKRLTYGPPQ